MNEEALGLLTLVEDHLNCFSYPGRVPQSLEVPEVTDFAVMAKGLKDL